ncbi:hypothetical protein EJB05_31353 [Eragrostis curvula]|uniref:Uncharacterized protein n=1 Tax=Eragrostis curvula TaxID=38414 RepID=A0A5J9UET1_9POAL|nr:hypothetical protein EJB05_31353 [Eragrostis curvula]
MDSVPATSSRTPSPTLLLSLVFLYLLLLVELLLHMLKCKLPPPFDFSQEARGGKCARSGKRNNSRPHKASATRVLASSLSSLHSF